MNQFIIQPDIRRGHIRKTLQGHFSEHLGRCIYGGLYVGENSDIPNVNGMRTDVVEALRAVKIPVLRWPGGCFADEYHWRDGIGPKASRKKMVNTHWGGVTEDNSFGTHEFMELCRQLGCDPYVNGNVGSGTVREMSEWVEYMTFEGVSPLAEERARNGHEAAWQLPYFGVGNENWGCGGNMTAEYYANEYRRYQTYVRQYQPDHKVYKIACGPSDDNYSWTETLMKQAGRFMDGLSVHYYTFAHGWNHKGQALDFTREDYVETLRKALYMDTILTRHTAIMDRYDPERRVGLVVDEWGTWYDVEPGTNPGFLYQQNTMRDAMVAGLTLNIFNRHCERVHMANLAQLVNVLQSLILTEGPRMLNTPTYYVFKLFMAHQENDLLSGEMLSDEQPETGLPAVQASASVDAEGLIHVTLVNPDLDAARTLDIGLSGHRAASAAGECLTGAMDAHNTFDRPEQVHDVPFDAFELTDAGLRVTLPPVSVVHLAVRLDG